MKNRHKAVLKMTFAIGERFHYLTHQGSYGNTLRDMVVRDYRLFKDAPDLEMIYLRNIWEDVAPMKTFMENFERQQKEKQLLQKSA